jgi:glycosyltransferase involved in cell wall biosynthesis
MEVLVSIIVPCFNQGHYLDDTLNSIMLQTHEHWECIIVDDGSSDSTALISQEWVSRDNRYKYIYQSNKGLSSARNAGIECSSGDFIQFLDADDIILPAKIEKQLVDLKSDSLDIKPSFSFTDYYFGEPDDIHNFSTDTVSPKIDLSSPIKDLIVRWETTLTIPCNAFLFRSSIFKDYNVKFDTTLFNHEDIDCWLYIFKLSPQIFYTDEKLCVYRKYEGSMSKNMKRMGEGFLQVLDKHILAGIYSRAEISLLEKKRKLVLEKYKRFDLMSKLDKIRSFKTLAKYYFGRVLQKIGIAK